MKNEGDTKPTILIVDDTPSNIAILNSFLGDRYRMKAAITGRRALDLAMSDDAPDLILLDIIMPDMDGYEVCRILKRTPATADIPVIFLTAKSEIQDEQKGLELGAVDYITKPLSPPIVLARIKTHLYLKSVRDFLQDKNDFLAAEVTRRTREIYMIQDVTMAAMGSLAETRDNETGNHIRRTQYYVRELSEKAKTLPQFTDFLAADTIELLYKSAPLHDIGKIGIPDNILLKPGRLTFEEFEIMKKHTVIGRSAILVAEKRLDSPDSFLRIAREMAWTHHEKWDGTGYPRGLSGEDIPVSGRIMGLTDVYDALISKRVYKAAFSHDEAVATIMEGSGSHFDPALAGVFRNLSGRFKEIAEEFKDETSTTHIS
jgi:putative two-component system response regulator